VLFIKFLGLINRIAREIFFGDPVGTRILDPLIKMLYKHDFVILIYFQLFSVCKKTTHFFFCEVIFLSHLLDFSILG
jgi:hypothetical protein